MVPDLQLLAAFSTIASVLFLWLSVYLLKGVVRLVSQSIHDAIRWEPLYGWLLPLLIWLPLPPHMNYMPIHQIESPKPKS